MGCRRAVHTIVIMVMLWSAGAAAQSLSYSQAKARADESEVGLGSSDMQRLSDAQGTLAGSAFAQCTRQTGTSPSSFTVVVELNSDGRVKNAWLEGGTRFARCFRDQMVAGFAFRPPSAPFFTSFEYTNARPLDH
jgi:hypothetical protein